jgi:hypothetical protein
VFMLLLQGLQKCRDTFFPFLAYSFSFLVVCISTIISVLLRCKD